MELVRLGDAIVVAYEKVMKILKEGIASLAEIDEQRDGLALKDRPSGVDCDAVLATKNGTGHDIIAPEMQNNTLVGLTALDKKRKAARPTKSRDKAPYEELSKTTRFCSVS